MQNGTLLKYNGTAGSWGWTATGVTQADIRAVKTATTLEVKIPKSNLLGLATTIKIGLETSNTAWTTTAIIPAISSPQAPYSFPTLSFAAPNDPIKSPPLSLEPYFYPNPSNGTMTLSFFVEQDKSDLEVVVYSLIGTPIKRFSEQHLSRGQQEKILTLNDLNSGTYLVKTMIGDTISLKRVTIVK